MPKKQAPMPSMQEVMEYLNAQTGHVGKRDLARAFGIKGDDRIQLKNMVRDLKSQGVLSTQKGGRRMQMQGTLSERVVVEITGLDSMGDLMARPLEWTSSEAAPQIMIVRDKLSPPAGVGDIVQAKVKKIGNKLYEGEAVRRVTAGENHMVGVFENGHVMSVDRRLKQTFSVSDVTEPLNNRDLIIVDIPPIRDSNPAAKFVRKIGSADSPFAATLISIYLHNLPVAFSKGAENEAKKAVVPPLDKNHEDLRAVPFVTIDGADARDFDDAVWAEQDSDKANVGGWHVMVAIADVCWYVRPGNSLDMDARMRGNSVYFPDRVLPMLPVELSNGMCSLNPNQDRAVMVCEAWLDKVGHKIRHVFRRALIRSARRLTYGEVQDTLDGKMPIVGLETEMKSLAGAYKALLEKRKRRGVLEIDVPERQVILNDNGQVIDIKLREMTDSNKLIEELMILANVSAAETLEDKGVPAMYRVHDRPSAQKIETLNNFLASLGQNIKMSEHSEPGDFNTILEHSEGTAKDYAINEFVLRSQSQAVYSPENIGHFGLALERYAHFTAPIRRYADILVHRALVMALKLGEGGLTKEEEAMFEDTARHISFMERQAASAEQDAVDRYIAGYLVDKIGAKFRARISSVMSFGLFLRLDEYGADGFVPMSSLGNDYYEYDDQAQVLVGRNTGITYAVGEFVDAILRECVPVTGGMLFEIVGGGARVQKGVFTRPTDGGRPNQGHKKPKKKPQRPVKQGVKNESGKRRRHK